MILREDVIAGIEAQLKEQGEFDPAHALLVRPMNGHYQIIRGHHRVIAAKRAGILEVPCWVRGMDDDDAYMQLALGNVQGELSPLEIGIHALWAVELGEIGQGRANKGGLGQYADALGKDRSDISDYKNAAEVITSIKYGNIPIFLKKAAHLALIHKLPHGLWPRLAQWLITPNGQGKTPTKSPVVTFGYDRAFCFPHVKSE